ncbi:Ig-like domain-containing protein [Parenemella sanctibonifatiensis]|uniref:Fibronectin type-III domain-containing protein n=1 Tax=Parenemella sanctibonifatiensis TaxID=2016505 RepID=A0A255EHE4_9ACTN|nr:Ig-like domain-containing protein [Parenemella sanctibonifatiensis]OYN88842.1 hypothetical protein CGZ92_03820 [Parenemella sanctibonifatiensis]
MKGRSQERRAGRSSAQRTRREQFRTNLLDSAKRRWGALVTVLVCAGLVVTAVVLPGYPITDLDLDDGQIFAVNNEAGLAGPLNYEIDSLAASIPMPDNDVEVIQEGSTILLRSRQSNILQRIDPGRNNLGSPTLLPANSEAQLGNGTVVVTNPTNGRLWARPVDQLLGTDLSKTQADLDLDIGGLGTVSPTGDVVGLSVERNRLIRVVGEGEERELAVTELPLPLSEPHDVQLSIVGDRAVVLDRRAQRVWVEGTSDFVDVPGGDQAQLQKPSAAAVQLPSGGRANAVLATPAGLFGVADDELVELAPGGGAPVSPVVQGECAYGAFGNSYGFSCAGAPRNGQIPEYAGGELDFQVNRDVVALNDSSDGNIWLVDKGMRLVNNWQTVAPPKPGEGTEEDPNVTEDVEPDRTQPNRAPVAEDDTLAVRAGRTTTIPVLDNDSDPDGDIITVMEPETLGGGAQLATLRGGTALQITVPENAGGTLNFSYRISDGRGGEDSAQVTLQILPADQAASNQAPVQRKRTPVVLPLGGTASTRVLLDWRDPDGDDLVLVSARAPFNDEVSFTPDGVLTFTDVGLNPGRKEVEVVVSDGRTETQGVVVIDARDDGVIPPTAHGDYVETTTGQAVEIEPLANDLGNNLFLSWVDREVPNTLVEPNFTTGTVRFTGQAAGTYYLGYRVSNGPTAFGLIRVDVRDPAEDNRPPVAARDVGLLPAGGSVLVDPLMNDEDPDNDVLVLQSVEANPNLQVEMIQRRLLRISAINTPRDPVSLSYTVSDGAHVVEGTIVIIPSPTGAETRPIAVRDEVTVRAGDAVTVDVLKNDYSPAGLDLTLDNELVENPGNAWVDGDNVRYIAPSQAGQYTALYQVRDSQGQVASAQVLFSVVSSDAENLAPQPEEVTGRVLAGTTTKVLIPLQGLDPNGDSVRLLGIDSGPRLGRIVSVGEEWLEYEAYPGSRGTDTFTYAVTDGFGATGVGTIRIGVVPQGEMNSPPTAVDDEIRAKPGRLVRVPVLANDFDPDGDQFGFHGEPDFPVEATVNQDMLEFQMPEEPGTSLGVYGITDNRGARTSGQVIMVSDPDAPELPVVTRDDMVAPADVVGLGKVNVPVLANDFDPDGDIGKARVSVPEQPGVPPEEQAVADGQHVQVVIGAQMRMVRYQVTDESGEISYGMITVPGRADAVPAIRPDAPELRVVAGENLDVDIRQHIVGTEARPVILTTEDRMWASNGSIAPLNPTVVRFRAPDTYAGPASITVEVTDGRNISDVEGRRTVLSLPVTVEPKPEELGGGGSDQRINQAPIAPSVTLNVGAGEAAETIDLTDTVTDPDGDGLTFTAATGDVPEGLAVRVEGSKISAQAEITAVPGTSTTFRGKVSDGRGGEADTVIQIVVLPSSKPLPRALDDVSDAIQGQTLPVGVLGNDVNPFDIPLEVIGAVVESPSGSGTARVVDGQIVEVTPNDDFVGTMVVRYTIQDATKSPDRRAEARIRLTVKGRPGKPGVVRLEQIGDGRLDVTFTAPSDNGMPISNYILRGSGGGRNIEQSCATTTCTITELTNDVPYTFTVAAVNGVGEGPESERSAEMRPDVRPDKPEAPVLEFGDQQLTVNWKEPGNRGSAIRQYRLQIQGPDGTEVRDINDPNARSYVWTGLENGSSYTVTVQAYNNAPDPSDFSDPSAPEVPAGPPGAPTGVQASDSGSPLGERIKVSWTAPKFVNGDQIRNYEVYANGQLVAEPTGTEAEIDRLTNGTQYTIEVVARNKSPQGSPRAAASQRVVPFGEPEQVEAPRASGGDQRVVVEWKEPATRGKEVTEYRVSLGDGLTQTVSGGQTRAVFTNVQNGRRYTARVQACSANKCAPVSDESNFWKPFGKPSISAERLLNGNHDGVVLKVTTNGGRAKVTGPGLPAEGRIFDGNGTVDIQSAGVQPGALMRYEAVTLDPNHGELESNQRAATELRAFGEPEMTVAKDGTNGVKVTLKNVPRTAMYCWVAGGGNDRHQIGLTDGAGNGVLNQTMEPGDKKQIACAPDSKGPATLRPDPEEYTQP